jgi:hypothetical protein
MVALLAIAVALGLGTPFASAIEGGEVVPAGGTTGVAQVWFDGQHSSPGSSPGLICSGSVVGPNKILTAEHCFNRTDYKPQDYFVLVGDKRLGKGTKVRVGNWDFHYDLAVLTLAGDVRTAPGLARVQVRDTQLMPAFGTYMRAYGFGRITQSGPPSPDLKRVQLRLADEDLDGRNGPAYRCRGIDGKLWTKDSGGPLFKLDDDRVQYGVTSVTKGSNSFAFSRFDAAAMTWLGQMHVPVKTGW